MTPTYASVYMKKYRQTERGKQTLSEARKRAVESGRAAEANQRYKYRLAEERDAQRLKELTHAATSA